MGERKLAITRFQKEEKSRKKQKEKPTYKRPSREAICVGFTHHQSKTPTLASEQRNAHPPQSPMSAVSPKMARLSARMASGLESLWPPPGAKKKVTNTISRPPHLPKREK